MRDQNGNVVGRVLTAIDDEGRLVRFPVYRSGNV